MYIYVYMCLYACVYNNNKKPLLTDGVQFQHPKQ